MIIECYSCSIVIPSQRCLNAYIAHMVFSGLTTDTLNVLPSSVD